MGASLACLELLKITIKRGLLFWFPDDPETLFLISLELSVDFARVVVVFYWREVIPLFGPAVVRRLEQPSSENRVESLAQRLAGRLDFGGLRLDFIQLLEVHRPGFVLAGSQVPLGRQLVPGRHLPGPLLQGHLLILDHLWMNLLGKFDRFSHVLGGVSGIDLPLLFLLQVVDLLELLGLLFGTGLHFLGDDWLRFSRLGSGPFYLNLINDALHQLILGLDARVNGLSGMRFDQGRNVVGLLGVGDHWLKFVRLEGVTPDIEEALLLEMAVILESVLNDPI